MSATHSPTGTRTSPRRIAQWLADSELAAGDCLGPDDLLIVDVASLDFATKTDLAYCDDSASVESVATCGAGSLIVPADKASDIAAAASDKAILPAADPQAAFIAVMMRLRPARSQPKPKIALDAYIAPTARVGENVHIAANVHIGEDARIGDDCVIHPGVFIGDGVTIGQGCVLHPNAVVHHDCEVGDRTILNANSVVGADGFGFRFETDHYERIPHTGRAIIGADCELGACATVDRGMIEDTVIGHGTKLDNHVMIAHNCRIGSHNAAAALVGLAGSVTSESYVRFGGNAGIADHCRIGQGASIGGKAAVIGDVPAGATYHGVPAAPSADALRQALHVRKLPEMRAQLRDLQKQIDALAAAISPQAAPQSKAA